MGDRENNNRKKTCVNLRNLVVEFHKDEKAQSIALGFVIIMGILLTATILILSTELPKQTKILEAEHAAKVPQDFAELGSAIDDVALSGDETASATCAIGLTSKSIPFVGVHASGGTLRFDNSSERFECLACSPGVDIPTGNGSWNCTNFTTYDAKLHVDDTYLDVCAKLELDSGEDRIYDSGKDEDLSGEYWFNNFTVTNNTTLYTYWLTIHAKNITVGQNSSINATGCGMAGGTTLTALPMSDSGKGEGGGNIPACRINERCICGAGGGGAGHYSAGGTGGYSWTSYGNHTGGAGGLAYENVTNTSTDMTTTASGSGGACGGWGQPYNYYYEGGAGGDGGGIIHLDAPILNIMGNVSVDGEDGHYSNDGDLAEDSAGGGGGGGSGGTIILKGGNINISGSISAKGGDGADGAKACPASSTYDSNGGGGGGGSGGVIKIFYGINLSAPGWLANHTDVSGGTGGLGGVGNGTYCDDTPPLPTPGGNGSAGGDGNCTNKSYPDYVESVPHYPTGWLVSNVTDIGYNATGANTSMIRYGTLTWTDTRPSGTGIYMKVRTSQNANMTGAMDWQDSPQATNGTAISGLSSVSNGLRYIQWRAELYTFERSRTPVLKSVNISYEYGLPVIADCKGSIEFSSHYFSLPNYILVYEHGATIKNQTVGGEIMLHPPPITISKYGNRYGGNTTSLKISAVNLTGDADTAGGVFSSAVTASYERADLVTGGLDFHNITLDITTEYPIAWSRWFKKTCENAGLNGTAGEYNITGTGKPLSIVFYGNDTNPVNVWLKESEVVVEVEG